ncbi:MAG: ABC transporter ATP-binding protein/permease [Bdellovibrionota bacterium]
MNENEKTLGQWSTIKLLLSQLWAKGNLSQKTRIITAMVFLLLAKLVHVYVPMIYKRVVDRLSIENTDMLVVPMAIILAYGLAKLGQKVFEECKDLIFVRVSRQVQRNLAIQTFEKLHQLSLTFHLDRKTGGLSRYIERGISGLEFIFQFMLFNIIPTLVELLLVTGILFATFRPAFGLITFISIILYIAATIGLTEWRIQYRRKMNESDTIANQRAVDSLINFETVKYFTNEKFEIDRYNSALTQYQAASVQSQMSLSVLNFFQTLFTTLCMVSVMYFAAKGVVKREMSMGDFVMVNTYMFQLFAPLGFLGFVYQNIKKSLIDMEKMFSIWFETLDIRDRDDAIELTCCDQGKVEFQNVAFAYNADRQILKNISFTIEPGKTLAIVGESGSGKSTISRLLFRFYEPQSGKIILDGHNILGVTQTSLRKQIGIVPQDTVLFNESIYYNIEYGKTDATEQEIFDVAQKARIHAFIQSLPQGYQTTVGERGLKLSGGEKQRVAIARTILKNPKILILDEATSALDTQTEKEIQKELLALSQNRTTLIIAHRLSTITHADEIIVLDRGEIIERGTHEELLAQKGRYATMWLQQLESGQKRTIT